MTNATIQINERHVGPGAGPEKGQALADYLNGMGWPAVYWPAERGRPRWHFATMEESNLFAGDYDRAMDALFDDGFMYEITWDCGCEEHDLPARCTCAGGPAGEPEPERPLWEWETFGELRLRVEELYPGLWRYLNSSLLSIYGAIAFGYHFEHATAAESATGLWLRREWPRRRAALETYDLCLASLGRLVDFASHDAGLSEYLAKNGLQVGDLVFCADCGYWKHVDCVCED